jgi:YfdX protein
MKKASKIVIIGTIIIGFLMSSCQSKTTSKNEKDVKKELMKIEMPAKLNMTEDEIALRDQEKAKEKILKIQEKMASEAVEAVVETQNAIQSLSSNTKEKAIKQLQNALGKIEIVTTRFPELELLPIDINVRRNVLITDINSVKQITIEAEKALKKEHLQEARELLSGLSSEIEITTVNIPLAKYSTSIKRTIELIEKDKLDEAKYNLRSTLNDLVIVKDMIPIPVLNAEVMIDEASRLHMEDRNANKEEIIKLLDNADYQLKLAEVLGYGKKDKTYKVLSKDIKSLKEAVKSNSELKTLFNEYKIKLKNFKQRVF